MRKYVSAGTILLVLLLIVGCGGSKGARNVGQSNDGAGTSKSYPELHWGMVNFPGPLDWDKGPYGQVVSIESLAVNNLMEFEPDGKVKPGLATSVEQPSPTTYVYHLKSVKFSDGKPMTAADVVYSLDRNIDGKESWTKSYWSDVSSVSAPNSSTVTVKLKRPSAIFQDIVAFGGEVVEKAAAERMSEKEIGTPGHMLIGTGPWELESYKPESSVQLSRNPYWSGSRPPAEKITVDLFKTEAAMSLALRSGAIDGADEYASPKVFVGIPGLHQLTAPGTTVVAFAANTAKAPFNDVHVRRALAYATDTKGIISALFPAGDAVEDPTMMPANLFATLGSPSEVDQMLEALPRYEFNLEKAKQELAKSAYPHGFTTPIEVTAGVEAQDAVAQILASSLAKIGINAKVDELTTAQASGWVTGKMRFGIYSTGSVYADPEAIMSTRLSQGQIYPPGGGQNFANYRNAEVDKLLAQSVEVLNKPKRLQMIGKLLGIVGSETPYRPLYTPLTFGSLAGKYVYPGFSWWTQLWTPWGLNVKLAS
jgi:peptide/nickel transport system substrate-binding protein